METLQIILFIICNSSPF